MPRTMGKTKTCTQCNIEKILLNFPYIETFVNNVLNFLIEIIIYNTTHCYTIEG